MKRIKLSQTVDKAFTYGCLNSYKDYLNELYSKGREGKDTDCQNCDDDGMIKISTESVFKNGKTLYIPQECDCVKHEKKEIMEKLEALEVLIKKYKTIFGTLDDRMTLDIFSKAFNQESVISSIKKYLTVGSSFSLFITGKSGVGKTTILKMLWQIYAMNKVSVFYLKANFFENMYKNLFNKNQKDNIQASINVSLGSAKNADILLIDDMDSVGFSSAVVGYYDIFDNRRKMQRPVIIASNKRYDELLSSYKDSVKNSSKSRESYFMSERITSRLLGLNIIEVELSRNKSMPKMERIVRETE